MNDELLIELVRQQPVLYDMKNKKYLDNEWKTTIWEEIGAKMKVDGKTCKRKWHALRSSYMRNMREYDIKKAQDPKRREWYLADRMNFLIPYIFWNKTSRKIKRNWCEGYITPEQIIQLNYNCETVLGGDETVTEETITPDNEVGAIHSKRRKTSTAELVTESTAVSSSSPTEEPVDDHPVLVFFRSLMPDIEKLSKHAQRRFKTDILQTLNYYLDMQESGESCQVSFSKPLSNSNTPATMELY